MAYRVLVTGSSGRIGRVVAAELLVRGHDVRGFDLAPNPALEDTVVATLTDRAAVDRATQGRDTLVHLAATPDDDDFFSQLLPNNIVGVYHVLESARAAGVKRLILASTGQVVWYERDRNPGLIRTDTQPTPKFWYAACKCFLEGAGRAFAEKYGLSVVMVRLGWCPRSKEQVEEIRAADWAQDVYLSPGDAGRFFASAVESPRPEGYEVVYATSKHVHRPRYDMEPTRRVTGFEPSEQWPQGTEIILGGK